MAEKKPKYEPPRVRSMSERQLFASEQAASSTAGGCGFSPYAVPYYSPDVCQSYAPYQYHAASYNPDGSRVPICRVADEDRRLVVAVELPGVKRDEVKVQLTSADMVLTAASADASSDLRFYGTLSFSEEVDVKASKARLENGVLTLVLSKVESAEEHILKID